MGINKNINFLITQYKNNKRYAVLRGGTGSGKTWSVLQFLISLTFKENLEVHIVGVSYPHLKNGTFRDTLKILNNWGIKHEVNNVEMVIRLNKSVFKYISTDKPEKFRGIRRDILFVNEVNLIEEDKFKELSIRTHKFIIVDFNPTTRFWLVDYFSEMGLNIEDFSIVSTYKDNPNLPIEVIQEIESRKGTEWYRVYGLGEWGITRDSVLYNYEIVDVDESVVEWLGIGVDIGYSISPNAAVMIGKYKNGVYVKEIFYGVSHIDELINVLSKYRKTHRMVVDAAATDEIEYMRRRGLPVWSSEKKSLLMSYEILNSIPLYIDKKSKNLVKEIQSLKWYDMTKGKTIGSDHSIDALRYAIHMFVK